MFRFTKRDGGWFSAVVLLGVALLLSLAELTRTRAVSSLAVLRAKSDLIASESRLEAAESQLAALGHPVAPHGRGTDEMTNSDTKGHGDCLAVAIIAAMLLLPIA